MQGQLCIQKWVHLQQQQTEMNHYNNNNNNNNQNYNCSNYIDCDKRNLC